MITASITRRQLQVVCRQRLVSGCTCSSTVATITTTSSGTGAGTETTTATTTATSSENIKDTLINASLRHVPQYGWTDDAVVAGTADVVQQLKSTATSTRTSTTSSLSLAGMITVQDLVTQSMTQWNEQFRNDLIKLSNSDQSVTDNNSNNTNTNTNTNRYQWNQMSMIDKIKHSMQIRLQYPIELIQTSRWHEGMALGLFPTQILTTQGQIKEVIDIICQYSSSSNTSSTDNYDQTLTSVEQFGLGAIYVATELHMLKDTSIDYVDTWEFLSNRINEWDTYRKGSEIFTPTTTIPTSTSLQHIIPKTDTLLLLSPILTSVATGIVSVLFPTAASQFVSTMTSSSSPPTTTATTNTILRVPSLNDVVGVGIPSSNVHQQPINNDGTDPSHYNVTK